MTKLLDKPLKAFIIYALIILGCSIPAYYWVVDSIWLDELDEHNANIKDRIEKKLNLLSPENFKKVIAEWNTFQLDTEITELPVDIRKKDSVYTVSKSNAYSDEKELDRFRSLSSYLHFHGKTYHLTVETNVEETSETMSAIAMVTFVFFVVLLLGFYMLNKRLSKSIWSPFHRTLHVLKTFDLTKERKPIFENTDIEEFEDLNLALNKLIDKNISVYQQQKTFIENASHELQTPLAVIKTKLDLLLQNSELSRAQAEQITALNLPLTRLSRINKNLLVLAKIDNNQFADTQQLNLGAILLEAIEMLTDYMANKEISVEQYLLSKKQITANLALVEILLNNLLSNAIIHNQQHGKLIINWNGNRLEIANTGFQPLSTEHLFKRFSKLAGSSSGNGLGLAIVREICEKYGWQISYHFKDQMHVFIVEF